MRVYDPEEDLPPPNSKVWAIFYVRGMFSKMVNQGIVIWNARKGWASEDFNDIEVLKWTDAEFPDLSEHAEKEKIPQQSED